MKHIDIYNNTKIIFERKQNISLNLYIFIITIFVIIFLVLMTKYEFQITKTYHGTIDNNSILLLIKKEDLNILGNYNLYIGNKKINYNYKIDSYVTDLTSTIYYNVLIITKDRIENSKCVFKSNKTTIIKEIKGKYK